MSFISLNGCKISKYFVQKSILIYYLEYLNNSSDVRIRTNEATVVLYIGVLIADRELIVTHPNPFFDFFYLRKVAYIVTMTSINLII